MTRRIFVNRTILLSAGARSVSAFSNENTEEDRLRQFERRIFARINEIRQHCGSPPLLWSDQIWLCALDQSIRKADLHFPGHVDPEKGDVAQRLSSRGVAWVRCGENLFSEKGYDDPVNLAVVCWWYSEGHRRNLLESEFEESAVGVAISSDNRIFATQIFMAAPDPTTRKEQSPARRFRWPGF
jgi:uncharacterized protein YkwD